MILFQNSLIKLDYSPATDIMDVAYPDLDAYLLPEIKHSIDILVKNVTDYDVKRVLLDSSNTTSSVTPEESREIAVYLASGLAKTRVLKVARLQSPTMAIENTAKNNIAHIKETTALPFMLENFTSREEALNWLTL